MAESKEDKKEREEVYRKYKEACDYLDKRSREQDSERLEEALRNLGGNYGRSGS
jgi:hypothetical protein